MIDSVKICSQCRILKAASEFRRYTARSGRKSGIEFLNSKCKLCFREYLREWAKREGPAQEHCKKISKEWGNKNKYKRYLSTKKSRAKNIERHRETKRLWRIKNFDKIRTQKIEWKRKNPDKVKAYAKKHYEKLKSLLNIGVPGYNIAVIKALI